MSDLYRATVSATDPSNNPATYTIGSTVYVTVDGSTVVVTANGLTGYTAAPGDRVLCSSVNHQLEIIQFISRTIPEGTPLYTGTVQAGSYSLGSSPTVQITLNGTPTNVTAVALPTYFPVAGDSVTVGAVAGSYELVSVPTVSHLATTPSGPDRIEIVPNGGGAGTDTIDFYIGGVKIAQMYADSGSLNLLAIGGSTIVNLQGDNGGNTAAAISVLGTQIGLVGPGPGLLNSILVDGARITLDAPATPGSGIVHNGDTQHNGAVLLHGASATFNQDTAISNGFTSQAILATTTGSAANVFIGSGGQLAKSTSSRRYKRDITDLALEGRSSLIDTLRPVTYKGINEEIDGETLHLGFIAEEVDDIGGWEELIVRDGEGVVDALAYERIIVGAIAELKAEKERVNALEVQNEALRARLKVIEDKLAAL